MININSVSLAINGKRLISDVSLNCPKGSFTALVGPNGAGKSTLLSLVAGDRTPCQGSIRLNGQDLGAISIRDVAQLRAVFPQGSEIRFNYPVNEIVAMGRTFRDLPPTEDSFEIAKAMADTEIEHLSKRNTQTLSGGEKARTTFARVLVQQTAILLLDEPIAALDLRHQERVLTKARTLANNGATVIVVLHDLNLAAAYADQVALMRNGKLFTSGNPWRVLTKENISEVYQQDVCILQHPDRECPVILTC